jgi:hypothetical protein
MSGSDVMGLVVVQVYEGGVEQSIVLPLESSPDSPSRQLTASSTTSGAAAQQHERRVLGQPTVAAVWVRSVARLCAVVIAGCRSPRLLRRSGGFVDALRGDSSVAVHRRGGA